MSVDRAEIKRRLRPSVAEMLETIETKTQIQVHVQVLPPTSHVTAEYGFDPRTNSATVYLGPRWEDVDVAHELTHMALELVEGFGVLGWKSGVTKPTGVESAVNCVCSYVDDEAVHGRLVSLGFQVDGEIIKGEFFNNLCTNVPANLRAKLADDGMSHLDCHGYGDLRRSAFLVQAELIREAYASQLRADHLRKLDDFIQEFRKRRQRQANRADTILDYFKADNVHSGPGQQAVLARWAKYEGLDKFAGITKYRKEGGRYVLPYP